MTAKTWRQMLQAATVPGYGYRYRRYLLDSLRYVDGHDLATGGDHIPELGDVFVDVALVSRPAGEASGDPGNPDAPVGPGDVGGQAPAGAGERHSIDRLLDRRAPAVFALVGQPGSGKSTLLAHAARRGAQTMAGGRRSRRRTPVLLALREQAAAIVADPAVSLPQVIRAAVGGAAGREPHGWWERQLGDGRCLVLLDGLDEVARDDDRHTVAGWVEQQIAAYPRNHFVVTSRTYGLPSSFKAQADVLVVLPFTAGQVRLFLERWYQAAERHATGAADRGARRAVKMRASESAARLVSLLWENPALYGLSVNPLLLTMIATAHRYRGALPGTRADLYGEMCQVLLSRRAQVKNLPELLPWPAKQALLAALAYELMRDHASDFAGSRAAAVLGPQLDRFPASVTGEALLEDVARNGLLVEAGAGRYAFTHLTFQEYLAARHVTANPDLVKSLADNVSDPWWHETILLYAATSDASPVVRACLDSGTIPALMLAFDCDEAGAEIDPDLRQRLDEERQRAYQPDCPRDHRRLIAGVQAARLARHTLATASGTRICARPVPADLYWLFLADTGAPEPDSPCVPSAFQASVVQASADRAATDQPAAGIWGTEARAFVRWLNSITAAATGLEVRLPHRDELGEQPVVTILDSQLPAAVTSAWTRPPATAPASAAPPELWVRPGRADPLRLPAEEIRQAVAADARTSGLLQQVLTAAVLDVAMEIIRDLIDARALSGALANDFTARANSGGEVVELMHAHAHSIVLTYEHALHLAGADAITRTCAAAPELISDLDLAPARALAEAIAGEVASAVEAARDSAAQLAAVVDQDLNVLSAFEFDLTQAVELHRRHAGALDRAYGCACGVADAPGAGLAGVFGLDALPRLSPAFAVPAVLGLPLRWVAGSPLTATLLQLLAAHRQADPHLAFARALAARAGLDETTQLRAALGGPLSGVLRDLTRAERPAGGDAAPDWTLATGLGRLADAVAPVDGAHQPPGPAEAAGLRAVALALAGGAAAPGPDAAGVLRTVAATVTLLESRSKGTAPAGESIILALV